MRPLPWLAVLGGVALAACAPVESKFASTEQAMFDTDTMDHLAFLEGRWIGTGPDGRPFYEGYRRVDRNTLVSERYEDATYAKVVDGSTVTLEDGAIISRWGDYSWRADDVRAGYASFAPVEAPSAFTWRRIDDDTVQVTQRWTDDAGTEQTYA